MSSSSLSSPFNAIMNLDFLPPFSLEKYIHTNLPLPQRLKPQVDLYLKSLDSELSKLDAIISDLETRLRIQKTKWRQFRGRKDMVSRTVAPIRSVPPEVLGLIFKYAIVDDHYYEYGCYGSWERDFFLNIRSVCKTWRQVSFSTSELWTGLTIESSWQDFHRAAAWFHRANGRPCSLKGRDPESPFVGDDRILSFITDRKIQWESVDLSLDFKWFFNTAYPRIIKAPTWQNTEELALRLSDRPRWYYYHSQLRLGSDRPVNQPISFFDGVPRLRKLHLDLRLHVPTTIQFTHPALTTLYLKATSISLFTILSTLKDMPALQDLTLYVSNLMGEDTGALQALATPFEHPLIRRLHIVPPCNILNYLALPSLEAFHIHTQLYDLPPVFDFLSRTGGGCKQLEISSHYHPPSYQAFVASLAVHTPSAERISVADLTFLSKIAEASEGLDIDNAAQWLPRLKVIDVAFLTAVGVENMLDYFRRRKRWWEDSYGSVQEGVRVEYNYLETTITESLTRNLEDLGIALEDVEEVL